jgi:hypothetical protein
VKPLVSGQPDDIDLELRWLDALDGDDALRVEQAARGDLREVVEEVEAFQTYWSAHRPPLAFAPAPSRWRGWRGWTALALAACAMVAVASNAWWAPAQVSTVRLMGGLPVDLQIVGDPAPSADAVLEPGDELVVSLRAPRDGVVRVYTLQEDGLVSLLYEQKVTASELLALPGAVRLDDYPDREWLIVELQPTDSVASSPSALLPDPGAQTGPTRWVREITRQRP